MILEDIFNENGLYVANGFAKGFCFEVCDALLSLDNSDEKLLMSVRYSSKDDIKPVKEQFPLYKSLFKKDYKRIYNIKQLFE